MSVIKIKEPKCHHFISLFHFTIDLRELYLVPHYRRLTWRRLISYLAIDDFFLNKRLVLRSIQIFVMTREEGESGEIDAYEVFRGGFGGRKIGVDPSIT